MQQGSHLSRSAQSIQFKKSFVAFCRARCNSTNHAVEAVFVELSIHDVFSRVPKPTAFPNKAQDAPSFWLLFPVTRRNKPSSNRFWFATHVERSYEPQYETRQNIPGVPPLPQEENTGCIRFQLRLVKKYLKNKIERYVSKSWVLAEPGRTTITMRFLSACTVRGGAKFGRSAGTRFPKQSNAISLLDSL